MRAPGLCEIQYHDWRRLEVLVEVGSITGHGWAVLSFEDGTRVKGVFWCFDA